MTITDLFDIAETNDGDGIDACALSPRQMRATYRAGEYLAAYDLSRAGYDCFFAGEALRYDLVVETAGGLIRVQVKATSGLRRHHKGDRPTYVFGEGGYRTYNLASYVGVADVFAFVALDIEAVMYVRVADCGRHIRIAPDKFTAERCRLSREQAFLVPVLS